jgi:hypothetical protein
MLPNTGSTVDAGKSLSFVGCLETGTEAERGDKRHTAA